MRGLGRIGVIGTLGLFLLGPAGSLASADSIQPTDVGKYKSNHVRTIAAPDPDPVPDNTNAPPTAYPMVDKILYEKSGKFIDDQWKILAMPDWRLILCLMMTMGSLRYIRVRREQEARMAPVIEMPSPMPVPEQEAA